MDPLSIAASVAGLLQAIAATCTTINTIRNLPKAFDHVKTHLPLVQKVLEDIRVRLRQHSLTEEERQTIAIIIEDCSVKAKKLQQIFDALGRKCKQDKDARSWDKLRGCYQETLRGIKGHRVESLMNDILEDMRKLGLYQTFRLATQEDIEEIKKALEEISHVEPSLDDATMDSISQIYATQNVGEGAMGQQNNPSGGTNTFNSGYNISGGTVNIGPRKSGFLCDLISHPPSSYSEFYLRKERLYRPSYQWVLSTDEFRNWHQADGASQLLWIKGNPGKGKTMLLCGIIDTLQEKSREDNGHDWKPIYFFCQATNNRFNSATSVVRGFLESLFDSHKKLRDKYDRTDISYNLDIDSLVALRETFKEVLQDKDLPGLYLVLDALDECRDGLEDLLRIIVDLSKLSEKIKILVSSRDWPAIERELNPSKQKIVLQLESNSNSISTAVNRYIDHRIDELDIKKGYKPDVRQAIDQHLKSNAEGTFLWVALVCEALAGMHVRAGHTPLILKERFPAGLPNLYGRMMKDIDELQEDSELCKQVLGIACVVYRPITCNELASLLGNPELQDAESIIGSCGSFLTVQEKTEVITFVHQSAKDFLLENQDASSQILPHGVYHQHYCVFSTSLQILSATLERDMYKLKDLGFLANQVLPPEPDPLASVRYSCVYWSEHLLELASHNLQSPLAPEDKVQTEHTGDIHTQIPTWYIKLIQLTFQSLLTLCFLLYYLIPLNFQARYFDESMRNEGIVHIFLKEKYLYWLEALSLLSSIPEGVKAMERLEAFSRNIKSREVCSLINDARRFILSQKGAIEIAPLQAYVSALVFSPSGSLINRSFSREGPKWIHLKPKVEDSWDACLQTLEGHDSTVTSVVLSNDGKRLASSSEDKTIKIWDATSGDCLQTLKGHDNSVRSVAFLNNGQRLASGSFDNTVKIWDATSGDCLQTLKDHNDLVESVVFLNDGQRLASCSWDKTIKIWDITSGDCLQTLKGHNGAVSSVVFLNNVQRLASGSYDKTIKIWDTTSGDCLQTLKGHSYPVYSVAFSNGNQRLASGSEDYTVKIWDLTSGTCLQTLESLSVSVFSVAFSHDGQRLASGYNNAIVEIWDVISGACLQTLEGHNGDVASMVFSNDGQRLISCSSDNTIKIWDTISGAYQNYPESHDNIVTSVVFSNDGQRLASCSWDKTIKIWDATSGDCLQSLNGHVGTVSSVIFSNNDQRLASASLDQTVRIWDANSGDCLQTLQCVGFVESVVFSNNNQQLASRCSHNIVNIWDTASGDCLHTFLSAVGWTSSLDDPRILDLSTEIEALNMDFPSSITMSLMGWASPRDHSHFQYDVCIDRTWIVNNGKKLLWLPPQYRPERLAVLESTVALGCWSGSVFLMRFSANFQDCQDA